MVINVDNNKLHYLTPKLTQKWDMLSYWDRERERERERSTWKEGRAVLHYQVTNLSYGKSDQAANALEYLKSPNIEKIILNWRQEVENIKSKISITSMVV